MNEYDSERIAAMLEERGMIPSDEDSADLVILNTCSVREKPQHKVLSYLGRLRQKQERSGTPVKIGVMGCVAQQEGEALLKQASCVDFVLGTDMMQALPAVLDETARGERVAATSWEEGGFHIPSFERRAGLSAHVSIMKGCNNFCSYCIVPYVRGREKSRLKGEILEELKRLTAGGVREITLLGQNVNSYGYDLAEPVSFAELLEEAAATPGLSRLRFVTSHPKDFSRSMVEVMARHENICPYIHLPLQAGSDSVLKRMRRGYTLADYMEKITSAREIIPGLAFSSDFITGFPGESEADFEKTLEALKTVRYESIFAFNYSPRPGTKAEAYGDDVPREVKTARLEALISAQEEISRERYEALIGKTMKVLVEGPSKRDEDVFTGRTIHNRIMNFTSAKPLGCGEEVEVVLTEAKRNSLFGEVF